MNEASKQRYDRLAAQYADTAEFGDYVSIRRFRSKTAGRLRGLRDAYYGLRRTSRVQIAFLRVLGKVQQDSYTSLLTRRVETARKMRLLRSRCRGNL